MDGLESFRLEKTFKIKSNHDAELLLIVVTAF